MDRTIHILPISQTLYGPYGPYRSTYQRVWIVRSIYSSIYQNIWTVRSIFSSTYQKIWIVRSIYGSTFPKMVEKLTIPNFVEKSKIFKLPYLQFPCIENPKSGQNPDLSKIGKSKNKTCRNLKNQMVISTISMRRKSQNMTQNGYIENSIKQKGS